MNEQDFAAVLERARAGDAEAVELLVGAYEPEVRRVARRRLGPALRSALETVDLFQSVHRSLLRCLRNNRFTFAGPQGLVALAVTMVKRKAARKWARLKTEREYLQLRTLLLARAQPERAAALAETLQALLEGLADADRQLLLLYLEGHTTAEAARRLGLDADSLRVRRSRLFRNLRNAGLDLN
jgi:RNA polymerase sigma-70 factor (ECF subfamily)